MRPSQTPLRMTLLVVILVNVGFAYAYIVGHDQLAALYGVEVVDAIHRVLAMSIGALLAVFALGALLAFLRPHKYGAIIIMLLLMHFSVFLIDVVIIAQGDMAFRLLFPEMAYFLIISTALVRWFPVREKQEMPKQPEKQSKSGDAGGASGEEIAAIEAIEVIEVIEERK